MDPTTLFHKRLRHYSTHSHISLKTLREYLSKNPKLTLEMVLQDHYDNNTQQDWQFDNLCFAIPCEELLAHGFIPTDPEKFSSVYVKPTVTTLKQYPYNWNWCMLSRHKNIQIEEIAAHPELPWYLYNIAYNPNLTLNHLFQYPHLFPDKEHVIYQLSQKASFEEITTHPHLPWAVQALSSPNIKTKEHILHLLKTQFKNRLSNYSLKVYLCMNPNLSFDDLLDLFDTIPALGYIEEQESSITTATSLNALDYAAFNPNTTFEHFQKFPVWFWKNIKQFANRFPLQYILDHPEHNWDWLEIVYCNKHITYENYHLIIPFLSTHIERMFRYTPTAYHNLEMLYHNKHLTHQDKKRFYEDILTLVHERIPSDKDEPYPLTTFLHPVSFVLQSPFFLEPTFQEIKEHFAKKKIIRYMVEVLSNPRYLQCRKRLMREHSGLAREHTGLTIV